MSQNLGILEYGIFVSVTSVTSLLFNVAGVRASEALAYFIARTDSLVGSRTYFIWAVVFDLVIVILLASVVRVFSEFSPNIFGIDWSLVGLGLVGASAVYLRGSVQGFLVGRDKQELNGAINTLEQILKIILLIWGGNEGHLSIPFVLFVQAVSAFICLVVSLVVYEVVNSDPKSTITQLRNFKEILRYLNFTAKVFSSTLFKGGNKYLDVLILTAFMQPQYVGMYGALKKILSPIMFITSPFSQIFLPRFIRDVQSGRHNRVVKSIVRSSSLLLCISVIYAIVAFVVMQNWDVGIETPSYFVPISIGMTVQIILWWTRPLSVAIDPMLSLYSAILATICMVVFCVSGTYFWGMWGFLLGNLVKVTTVALYWFWVVNRRVVKGADYLEAE